VLFIAAAAISGFTILRGVDPFDEGLVLQAARRVAHGQVPYRDFLWAYGPAQVYLLAGLSKLFGASLLQWRILRVLADAGVALVVFVLLRREAGTRIALAGWLAAATAIAQPRSANPFALALVCTLATVLVASGEGPARRRTAAAALLTAVAAAFRLDFGIYAAAAGAFTFWAGDGLRAASAYVAGSALLAALLYLPFALADGIPSLYQALVGTSLREAGWWTLPFPIAYHGPLSAWPPQAFLKDAKHVVDYYVPLLLVAGLVVTLAVAGHRTLRGWPASGRRLTRRLALPPSWAGLLVLGLGFVLYLRSRTDEFHTQPLLVVLAVLLPAAALAARPRWLRVAATAVFALLLAHGVANRGVAAFQRPDLAPVHARAADGVQAPRREAQSIDRLVRIVDRLTRPGAPIYVAPRRADLVRFNDALVYVLVDRDNPTRRDFGLLSRAGEQREAIAALERARPRVVVRWTDPLSSRREPNLSGHSSGVHLLDRYLLRRYRPLVRLYHYDVLVRR